MRIWIRPSEQSETIFQTFRSRGDLQKIVRDPTGEQGRAPEVYHLSDTFKTTLEDYLNKKGMKLGFQLDLILSKSNTIKDAEQSLPDMEPINLVVPGFGMYGLGSAQAQPARLMAEKERAKNAEKEPK